MLESTWTNISKCFRSIFSCNIKNWNLFVKCYQFYIIYSDFTCKCCVTHISDVLLHHLLHRQRPLLPEDGGVPHGGPSQHDRRRSGRLSKPLDVLECFQYVWRASTKNKQRGKKGLNNKMLLTNNTNCTANVTLDHKTSHKGKFFEIEIYTSERLYKIYTYIIWKLNK